MLREFDEVPNRFAVLDAVVREELRLFEPIEKEEKMLSEKLINLRRKQGLSQQEVAQALGVTRQTISNWECGQGAPAIDKAKDLALLYHVGLDDLVSDEIAIVTPAQKEEERDLHVLRSLVGSTCKLFPVSMKALGDHYEDFADGRKYRILGVEDGWLRVEYDVPKGLTRTEPAVSLIDISLIGSLVMVGDAR